MSKNDGTAPVRWGAFRFAVVGKPLVSPPKRGELQDALAQLAEQVWEHPVTGEPRRFAVATLERWYYQARNAHRMTLPYSPYQNGKQEAFWNQVENRFLAMLEGCRELSLQLRFATPGGIFAMSI